VRNSPAGIKVKEGGGGGAPGTGAEISLQPTEGPWWSSFILQDCRLWSIHTGAGEKREQEGAAERSCYQLTTAPQIPSPVQLREEGWGWRGVRNEEVKLLSQ